MSLRRSPVFRYCLALLLVFAQQQAVVHALEHDGGGQARWQSRAQPAPQDDAGHPAELCAKCLALAHLHHVSGVAEVRIAVASYAPPRTGRVRIASASPDVVLAYRSRAPPSLS